MKKCKLCRYHEECNMREEPCSICVHGTWAHDDVCNSQFERKPYVNTNPFYKFFIANPCWFLLGLVEATGVGVSVAPYLVMGMFGRIAKQTKGE